MAYSATTSLTTLTKLGKHIQGSIIKGFARRSEEYKLWRKLKDFELRPSQRDVTTIIDIQEARMGSFISEGGYEANVTTIDPQELTFTWAHYNDRNSWTKTGQYLEKKFRDAMVVQQSKYQVMKNIEGLTKRVGLAFYGVSTGELAQTTTIATQSSGTYVLANGFGRSDIDDTTYLARIFRPGDYVALVRSAALVTNAIGLVTASSTSGIAVTWAGSVTSASGDSVVLANSIGHQLITGSLAHTDYNKAPLGMLDFAFTDSVHGLANSSWSNWGPAMTDTAGSSITGTRLRKGQDEIANKGGGKADLLIMSQGTSRDLFKNTVSAVHFNDPLGMEVIGSVKTGSIAQHTSPFVPPGYAFLLDRSDFYKWDLTGAPGEDDTSFDGMTATTDKLQDINADVNSFDFLFANVVKKRASLAVWTTLAEA